jgi:hypothetical protein
MNKKSFTTLAVNSSNTVTRTIEHVVNAAEKLIQETAFPAPPSEETVARLNAIAREYPFCVNFKQRNLYLL